MAHRMEEPGTEHEAQPAPATVTMERQRGRGPSLLLATTAFVLGAGITAYAVHSWRPAAELLTQPADPAQPPIVEAPPPPQAAPSLPLIDPMAQAAIDQRVSDIEARLGRIDARASAAVGNADRAEGLLVAFAARRALDRGVQLGYIEGLLRDRFGESQPQAVATIIAASRQPVTLDDLRSGLSDVAPALASQAPNESWWDGVKREIAGMIVIRKANRPSPAPADRLARARRALEGGRVTEALAEVSRMPGRERAQDWIAAARRYAGARDALDTIETAALLAPRAPAHTPPAAETPAPGAPANERAPAAPPA
ncbi:hypothetical protein BHE75_00391 [Sphingomonas haloaromaticamans]|uniref:Mitochondrial inner membrane protein n=2 Tax=Edaphosphingomonas haloaromaticamans TaxID=653954 RepID=A0A1S1HD81_9SPHN|nr:hypothetical protein BHE75_00391 [Sphingomonas haloaromaticamans]